MLGSTGDDFLSGGSGADVYIFANTFGDDVISGFEFNVAGEQIDLQGVASITGFGDLSNNHMSQSGAHTIIDDGNGNTIRLNNVDMDDLSANDFIF